tara:strand:- start:2407 stop:3735 length:1329 start_codon:yes stop_codon:yes gene_type:complete
MNFSDSEIVSSILLNEGFNYTKNAENADLILINTCSIREKAEDNIRNRLSFFNSLKKKNNDIKIGVLGCMAERLKEKLLHEEKVVDIVAGPDSYRNLPELIKKTINGQRSIDTKLSKVETYDDIIPHHFDSNNVSGLISIMRGCDNMCSFCVVPFTRGRERSRNPFTIVKEAEELFKKGIREVTLLGQNVDSYKWSHLSNNKKDLEKLNSNSKIISFANLLEMVALVDPNLRIRFSTSHPKDITDEVLYVIKKYENICNYIHLPAQSGNNRILKLMNRTYTREWYLNKINSIRNIVGDNCGISSDFISGFCSETDKEHRETLSLMDKIKYDYSYTFSYSERKGTMAERKFNDDIPNNIKQKRLSELIIKQREHSLYRNKLCVNKTFKVLIEGLSKKSKNEFKGRSSENKMIVFPKSNYNIGDYVNVKVLECNSATLFGEIIN